MAANNTASTITVFLKEVIFGAYIVFYIKKNSTSMLHVVTGNAKNMII